MRILNYVLSKLKRTKIIKNNSVFNEKNFKRSDNFLCKNKSNTTIINKIENPKRIEIINYLLKAENNLKMNIFNNKSILDDHVKSESKEKTYVKKLIQEKISKIQNSIKDNSCKYNEDKNDKIYNLIRPINTNFGSKKNVNIFSAKDEKKTERSGKNTNLRHKSMINNKSLINKKLNLSEINNKCNTSIHNNSFLYFQQNNSKNVDKTKTKNRQTSTSTARKESFNSNSKEINLGKNELATNKYVKSKFINCNNLAKDTTNFNKTKICGKNENLNIEDNLKKTSINLNGVSLLKRLSNKKSLNINLKDLNKIGANIRKRSNFNYSISVLND